MGEETQYWISCYHCGAAFNAFEAAFCNHTRPTKLCPFCLKCFCAAPAAYREKFWKHCPEILKKEFLSIQECENPRLGEILVRAGRITREILRSAIEKQKYLRKPLGEILIMMGLLTPEDLRLFLAEQKTVGHIDLKKEELDLNLVRTIGVDCCIKNRIVPVELYCISINRILRFAVESSDNLLKVKNDPCLNRYVLIPYVAVAKDFEFYFRRISGLKYKPEGT